MQAPSERVVKDESKPKPVELKLSMSLEEMQSKQRELDERARIAELAGDCKVV
jgi:hypothetical protein